MPARRRPARRAPAPPPPARRLWLFRLLALALPILALLAFEAALRLAGYGFDPHFFKLIKIGGADYYVQNDAFSYRFFPPQNARNPGAVRLPAVKPPDTIRLFVLGESAAMGDPEPAYGPARYLEIQLRHKFPNLKFEVVNVAFTAINSHVILPIARECARHAGDFWIIYMGNNEMVGPFGAATVFGRRAPPLPYVRLVTALQTTRTGQLLTAVARRLGHTAASRNSWGGMEMFIQNQIPPDSPLRENVYRSFQQNLEDILRAGTGAGVKILLSTVAVNLRDCPPFASLPAAGVTAEDRAAVRDALALARRQQLGGDLAGAVETCAAAARRDPQEADLQFLWGQCLHGLGDDANARVHLQQACDDDALPFRTDARINQDIQAAAARHAREGVTCFDARGQLASLNPDGLCGDETFYEHVHFDFTGSYRLGTAWAQAIEPQLPPGAVRQAGWLDEPACEAQLGLSDWNRLTIWKEMAGRYRVPPFSTQAGNDQREARLLDRIHSLQSRMDAADASAAETNFAIQLRQAPDDFELHENHALFLQATGDLPGAVAEWRRVHDLIPQDYLPYYQIGRFLSGLGQRGEAEAQLRTAVQIHPSLTAAWYELANVQAAQGRYAEALDNYSIARAQNPLDAATVFRMGKVCELLGQTTTALQDYRAAARLDTDDWQIHFQLGGILDAAGDVPESLAEFATAARLNPGYSHTHFNYAVELAKSGRLTEARREFAEAVRLDPAYQNARDALAKVDLLLERSTANPPAGPTGD